MSKPIEIRCTGPHPDNPRVKCRARLCDAIEGTVSVTESAALRAGCTLQQCPRCRKKYLVCPLAA